MPNMDFYNNVVVPTMNGEYDEYLDNMIEIVRQRRAAKSPQIWEFQVGSRVRFNAGTKPKYLQGVEGTVRKVNRSRIVVDLDERHERFFKNITVPLSLVDKV
jgi:FKBP-type peptidyl-prolyl cis-trans isomerase 2